MPNLKRGAIRGFLSVLRVARVVVVALVCLLVGVSARHLFDAYGRELIPFLKQERVEAVIPSEQGIPQPLSPSFRESERP
jgi:hypothetical protein